MNPRLFRLLPLAAIFVLFASEAGAETITGARYANPVERYGHFALGRPHEYARLTATTDAGRRLAFDLPEYEVFEDLEPRLVRLATGEPMEVLAIVSQRDSGSRLVLIRLSGGRLVEVGRCAVAAPVTGPLRIVSGSEVSIGLASGQQAIVLNECLANR